MFLCERHVASLDKILDFALPIEAGILLIFFTAVFATSIFEKEERAAFLALICGLLLSFPFLLPVLTGFDFPAFISLIISLIFILSLLALFLPLRGRIACSARNPAERFDERDTMFSRRMLVPGTFKTGKAKFKSHQV